CNMTVQKQLIKTVLQLLPSVQASALVPEIQLSILTSNHPLWHVPYEKAIETLGTVDPWWSFFWPGGQGLARYILDNRYLVRNKRLLDIGCGCGGCSIAAKLCCAKHVTANDIDEEALTAVCHNAILNAVQIHVDKRNFLLENKLISNYDVLTIGDMFYDEELAQQTWNLIDNALDQRKIVLLADPGRYYFTKHLDDIKRRLKQVAEYPVDQDYIEVGFNTIKIFSNKI
ncbi:unnamed protein product, partial [Didymodactylos carnosus]